MERKEIFRDRKSIDEFGVDAGNTINKALFDVLFQVEYVTKSSEMEETLLGLFNDAYYICTLILLEKRPYFKMQKYKDIASGCEEFFLAINTERAIIVMLMVSVYLKTLDKKTDDIEKIINLIHSDYYGRNTALYERVASCYSRTVSDPTKATEFFPFHFPEKEECSDFWKNYEGLPQVLAKAVIEKTASDDQNAKKLVAAMEAKIAILTEQAAQREKNIAKLITENEKLKRRADELEIQYNLQMSNYQKEMEKVLEERLRLESQKLDSQPNVPQLAEIKSDLEESKKRNEMSQKQIEEMREKINMLREKLGTRTIPLESLAEGLKRYAEVFGIDKGKDMFLSLSHILITESAWTKNVKSLENFFIKAERENKTSLLTLENNQGGVVQITGN